MASFKHHYIPEFYLKRWALKQGKLVEFSKPYGGKVVPKRVHPGGTGYQRELYSIAATPKEFAQSFEDQFLSPVDSLAADALMRLETQGAGGEWNGSQRSAWSRFLTSLLMRMPEDIASTRSLWLKYLVTPTEAEFAYYAANKQLEDPESLVEALASHNPAKIDSSMFKIIRSVIDGRRIGEIINGMHWQVIDVAVVKHRLFTSDRPVLRTNGLNKLNSQIVLPIGPTLLFVAAKSASALNEINEIPMSELVLQTNGFIVGGAVKFVYAHSDAQLRFVQNRMGGVPQRRLTDSLLQDYGKK